MQYAIVASVDFSDEDLAELSGIDFEQAGEFILGTEFRAGMDLSLDVRAGEFVFPDGRKIPFENYKAAVGGTFDQGGDRYWVTTDGGMINMTTLLRALKEAYDARP